MDPDACLTELRELAATTRADADKHGDDEPSTIRWAELVEALDMWLKGGGFLPRDWARGPSTACIEHNWYHPAGARIRACSRCLTRQVLVTVCMTEGCGLPDCDHLEDPTHPREDRWMDATVTET